MRLSAAEKAERTRLGLCWYCPDKWVDGHSCKGRFLVYVGADDDSEDELDDPSAVQSEEPVISADISHIYALECHQQSDAIELLGSIGATSIRILVDTGSSHDFLHPTVAEKLSLPLKKVRPFRVYVGNGESLLCSYASIQTRIVIQTHVFFTDLHILPVHGPDVILGMAWLKTLRRVTSDYERGTLEFSKDGKQICLKLIPPGPREVSLRKFSTLLSLQGDAELFELVQLPDPEPPTEDTTPLSFPPHLPEEILSVLEQHAEVFKMPMGMPPPRQFDHKIHLLPQTKPVIVRPYRYPYFQKTDTRNR